MRVMARLLEAGRYTTTRNPKILVDLAYVVRRNRDHQLDAAK
jgi:hypothetical protein